MHHERRRFRHTPLVICLGAGLLLTACETRSDAPIVPGVPGVEYTHLAEPGPLSIHVVSFDLADPNLSLLATVGSGVYGSQTVPAMAAEVPAQVGEPLAMVNGDYFEFLTEPRYRGTLQGMCLADGELVAAPAAKTFWIDAESQPHLEVVSSQFTLGLPDGSTVPFGLNCSTSDFRSEVRTADFVVYTPAFGAATNTKDSREYVLSPASESDALPLQPNATIRARVIRAGASGSTRIEPGTMVLSIAQKADERFPALEVGDELTITTTLTPDMTGAPTATSGDPLVLADGKIIEGLDNTARHPRTAVGFAGTRCWLVVIDGRQPELSIGMSHHEVGALMRSLGCTDALNLDGGGSSTFWYAGQVRNRPSDGQPRPVGSALVLVRTGERRM